MIVRILADREPYTSFAESSFEGEAEFLSPPPKGSCPFAEGLVVLCGPGSLDEAFPDIVVLHASDYLVLHSLAGERQGLGYIAYGPVSLMAAAFDRGCLDYMREPWSPAELRARLAKLSLMKFRVGASTFKLKGSVLIGLDDFVQLEPHELAFLRFFLNSAPLPVPKDALIAALPAAPHGKYLALSRYISPLRHKLDALHPGLGRRLHAVRGLGYRFDVNPCA